MTSSLKEVLWWLIVVGMLSTALGIVGACYSLWRWTEPFTTTTYRRYYLNNAKHGLILAFLGGAAVLFSYSYIVRHG